MAENENKDILSDLSPLNYDEYKFSKRKRKAVELLINGDLTRTEIAAELGITRTTLYRWMNDARFQAELQKETDQIKRQAALFIDRKAYQAAKKLWELAECGDNRTKVNAVDSILNRSIGKANTNITIEDNRENKGFDLMAALAEIESEKHENKG